MLTSIEAGVTRWRRLMMGKKYIVRLSEEERQSLQALVGKGKAAAYKIRHANILLKADADGPAWTDEQVAKAFGCHVGTVENVRSRCVLQGLQGAVERKKQSRLSREYKLDGEGQARLIAVACSQPPPGRDRWTLELLADELVRLQVVDSISGQTVRRTLKKTSSSPTASSAG
jgi:transposase